LYRVTSVENQKLFWVPYNENTKNLFYDQRAAISAPRDEPVCWSISKVEDMNVKGIIRLTWKQDRFNSHTDLIEYNKDGEYVGAWCDYYKDGVPISEEDQSSIPSPSIHSLITFSGVKPEVKVNGSYKKFIVRFYDDENNENNIPVLSGNWEFRIRETDLDASDLIDYEEITPIGENMYRQIKLKFIGGDEWISKNLQIWYVSDTGIKSHLDVNIVGI